jgi:hypothetical protein
VYKELNKIKQNKKGRKERRDERKMKGEGVIECKEEKKYKLK